jgi:ElaB/YqjD/DUF883 family membrane-anchored ribosome-binding protein
MSTDSTFDTPQNFASDADKSPETLEREIDAQRSNIGSIVNALEGKFSPGQLLDQALTYSKGSGGEFVANLGNTIKANPVPTLLTSIGLAWLMMGQNKQPVASAPSSGGSHLGERLSDMAHSVTDTLSNARARAGETAHNLRDKGSQLTGGVSGALSASGERLNRGSHDVSDSLHEQGRRVHSGFNQLLREQPLALAAIGVAIGAALGAALPSTEKENAVLGRKSDALTGKVKHTASESYDKVTQAVKPQANDGKAQPPVDNNAQAIKPGSTEELGAGLG